MQHIDSLIIQTYYWRPCMETAADLAMQLDAEGRSVFIHFIDADDPFEPVPFGIWPIHAKKIRKYKQLYSFLNKKGILSDFEEIKLDSSEFINLVAHTDISTIDQLIDFELMGAKIGRGVLSSLVTQTGNPYPELSSFEKIIEKGLVSSCSVYESTRKLLKNTKPDEVIIYNGRFATVNAVAEAARSENINIRYFEEGSNFKKFNVFEQSPFDIEFNRFQIDKAWREGGDNKVELAHNFFLKQRGGKMERKSFILNQKPGFVLDKTKRRITYFSSSDDEMLYVPVENSTGKSSIFSSQREAVAFLIDWANKQESTELVIRIHPHISKKSSEEIEFWDNLSGTNVVLIASGSKIDSYALLESSDAVITYNSTIGFEATYWGVPSISLCRSAYENMGCCYEPKHLSELTDLLKSNLAPLPRENCYPYAYRLSTSGNFDYQYYRPVSWSDGFFCDKRLSMDLPFIDYLKRSKLGEYVKQYRDRIKDEHLL